MEVQFRQSYLGDHVTSVCTKRNSQQPLVLQDEMNLVGFYTGASCGESLCFFLTLAAGITLFFGERGPEWHLTVRGGIRPIIRGGGSRVHPQKEGLIEF